MLGVGSKLHSSTLSHGFVQTSASLARSAQYPSGSSMERLYSASYSASLLKEAFFENSGDGGKSFGSSATLFTSHGPFIGPLVGRTTHAGAQVVQHGGLVRGRRSTRSSARLDPPASAHSH